MKKNLLKAAVLALVCAALFSGCSGNVTWYTSLDAAKAKAQKSNKNIFLVFSGDDWVTDSQNFKDNIANQEDFIKEMQKNYVLCNVDFSQNEYAKTSVADDASEEEKKEAEKIMAEYEVKVALAQKYNLYQYPSVFLLTKDEYVIAAVPFDSSITTVEAYLDNLKTYDEQVAKVVSIVDRIKKSKSLDKARAIDELYDYTVENTEGYVSPWLDEYIKEFPSLDPDNETGNVARYQMAIAYQEAVVKAQEGDIDGASEAFVNLCETSQYLSNEDRQTAYYTAAYVLASLQSTNYDRMIELLDIAYSIDSESEIAAYLLNARNGVMQMKELAVSGDSPYEDSDEDLSMNLSEGETSE